jgi:hypothetical protein
MAKQKVPDARWQPKALWTARRLTELSKEVGKLRQKVRVAEAALSKSSTPGACQSPSVHVPRH